MTPTSPLLPPTNPQPLSNNDAIQATHIQFTVCDRTFRGVFECDRPSLLLHYLRVFFGEHTTTASVFRTFFQLGRVLLPGDHQMVEGGWGSASMGTLSPVPSKVHLPSYPYQALRGQVDQRSPSSPHQPLRGAVHPGLSFTWPSNGPERAVGDELICD